MARSAAVVVPLLPTDERSGGRQPYPNAMALGKLVIASDVSGVRDHIVPGEHVMTVPPRDGPAMRGALTRALDPANTPQAQQIAARGRELASSMTPGHYCA